MATVAAASSGASGRRRRRRRRSATALRAIWKSHTRNVDAPSPSARSGPLLEAPEVRQRVEEGARGRVLRLVVVAQFVEGVAVHLGEVLPIEGLEPGRVRLGRLDETPVAIEMGKARTPLLRTVHLPECRTGHGRYTAAEIGSSSRT